MSFIEDLNNRQRRQGVSNQLLPQAQTIPINLPQAHGGLSESFREPYRVNGPLNAPMVPATRSRASLPLPLNRFRR